MTDQNHFLTEGEKILWQKTFFDKEERRRLIFLIIITIFSLPMVIIVFGEIIILSWIFLILFIIALGFLGLILTGFIFLSRKENYLKSYYITEKRIQIKSKHPPKYEDYEELPDDYIDRKENCVSINIGRISQFEVSKKAKGVVYFYITYNENLHSGMIFASLDDLETNSIIEILTEKFGYKFKESYDIYDLYVK